MSVETVSNSWRKKKSTFRYFCQDSQRGPNLLSDSLLTTQNRSATRSASGRGHWPTPPTWIRLSLSHNGSAPELFWALGSVVFVSSCWWTRTNTTSLSRDYLYSPDPFPSPSTRWRLPEPAAARHEPRVLIISHVDFSLVLTNNPVYISLIRKDREKYSNYEKQRWLCDDGLHDTTWTAAAFCCLARGAVSARTNHETYLHS